MSRILNSMPRVITPSLIGKAGVVLLFLLLSLTASAQPRARQQAQQSQQDFQKAQQEKMQPILNKVREAIQTVAKSGGYVYVMDTSSGSVLYINDSISKDLTAEVKAQIAKMK